MADTRRPDPSDPVDLAPDKTPAALWRDGPPHAQKPKEPHRIHPGGDQPSNEDDDGRQDDDEDGEQDDRSKKPQGKQGRKKKEDDKSDGEDDDEDDEPKDTRPIYKKPVFWIGLVLLVVASVVGTVYWLHARHFESTDDAYIEGHVVQISPQVSARVLKVYVDDNTYVRAGDPLVDLDPIDYQVALDQAKGGEDSSQGKLEQAKAQVDNYKAERDEAKANLDSALANFENADRDLKRYEALDDKARSKQQYDQAIATQKAQAASVNQAKAKLASAESQISVAIANVTTAQGDYETSVANRKKAEVQLGYCRITAESSGRVTSKNVEPGMYASTGAPMFAVVRDDVWVVANYKETQLTDMRIGQPVSIKIDAYPDYEIRGKVESMQSGTGSRFSVIPAENATGNFVKVVQRVPVKITFDQSQVTDKNHLLAPGMSVVPYVTVR